MIAFVDFRAHALSIRKEVESALRRALARGHYILGPEVEAFESEFATYLGGGFAAGVASGTDALTLSLLALGVGPGDEVLVPALTAYPTIVGVMRAGATPVAVDVRDEDGLIDAALAEKSVTRRTRAIIPVHLYGQSCDMDAVRRLARRHRLFIVEDCAHATGASFRGRKVGLLGDCGAFSFYPTKNLGAFGDGGAVVARDKRVRDRIAMLRNYGQSKLYSFDDPRGFNSRLDELQAAVLRVKLRHLDRWNRRRRSIANHFRRVLGAACVPEHSYGTHVYHQFVIKTPRRDDVMKRLRSRGVPTLVHYPFAVHRQKSFPGRRPRLPVAETLARTVLSLPVHPHLTDAQVRKIANDARAALEAR